MLAPTYFYIAEREMVLSSPSFCPVQDAKKRGSCRAFSSSSLLGPS